MYNCLVVGPLVCLLVDRPVKVCPRSKWSAYWRHNDYQRFELFHNLTNFELVSSSVQIETGRQIVVSTMLEMSVESTFTWFPFTSAYLQDIGKDSFALVLLRQICKFI